MFINDVTLTFLTSFLYNGWGALTVLLVLFENIIILHLAEPDLVFLPQEGDFILRVHVERYSREIPENHMTFDLEKGAQLTQSEERLQQQQQHH